MRIVNHRQLFMDPRRQIHRTATNRVSVISIWYINSEMHDCRTGYVSTHQGTQAVTSRVPTINDTSVNQHNTEMNQEMISARSPGLSEHLAHTLQNCSSLLFAGQSCDNSTFFYLTACNFSVVIVAFGG